MTTSDTDLYVVDKLCFKCDQWAKEQTNKIFGSGLFNFE